MAQSVSDAYHLGHDSRQCGHHLYAVALSTWLPAYLERERHLSLASTGWLVSIPCLFGTIGMLSSGFVADALQARGVASIRSRKWPICVGLIGGAVFTVPAAFTPNLTLAIFYLSVVMFFVQMACVASRSQ